MVLELVSNFLVRVVSELVLFGLIFMRVVFNFECLNVSICVMLCRLVCVNVIDLFVLNCVVLWVMIYSWGFLWVFICVMVLIMLVISSVCVCVNFS